MNGVFLTAAVVAQRAPRVLSDALLTVPALVRSRAQVGRNGVQSRALLGRGGCPAVVYVDGIGADADELDLLVQPSDVRGVEVYTTGEYAPGPYARGTCAVVLVWTKNS